MMQIGAVGAGPRWVLLEACSDAIGLGQSLYSIVLQSAVCCKKNRRWLSITLTDDPVFDLKLSPREQAGILIILLLAGRSGIKRSSFLSLVLCWARAQETAKQGS